MICHLFSGVMFPPIDQVTKQGHDLQFGVSVLGHFYLTKLLLPVMLDTAKDTPNGKVRVVSTSSSAMLLAPPSGIDYATLKDGPVRRRSDPVKLYQQAKAVGSSRLYY